jgi:hypothetical protein
MLNAVEQISEIIQQKIDECERLGFQVEEGARVYASSSSKVPEELSGVEGTLCVLAGAVDRSFQFYTFLVNGYVGFSEVLLWRCMEIRSAVMRGNAAPIRSIRRRHVCFMNV